MWRVGWFLSIYEPSTTPGLAKGYHSVAIVKFWEDTLQSDTKTPFTCNTLKRIIRKLRSNPPFRLKIFLNGSVLYQKMNLCELVISPLWSLTFCKKKTRKTNTSHHRWVRIRTLLAMKYIEYVHLQSVSITALITNNNSIYSPPSHHTPLYCQEYYTFNRKIKVTGVIIGHFEMEPLNSIRMRERRYNMLGLYDSL